MPTYIYDRDTGKVIPKPADYIEKNRTGMQIIRDVEPFVSPVTGEVIGSRNALREHNRRNEVVDRRELKGHKFETPKLPPVGPDVARAFKEVTGKL